MDYYLVYYKVGIYQLSDLGLHLESWQVLSLFRKLY